MARTDCGRAIKEVCKLFETGTLGNLTDGELLERFLAHDRDTAEASFAAIVDRHGPMVLRVCSMVLRNEHDAIDAFQASFLILVHKARALRVRDSLGPWLHQVALRVSSCARSADLRRRKHERAAAELNADRGREHRDDEELASLLHLEIDRLPDRYRRPIVLCCVAGLSREQAAFELGWPVGTVQSRLARGRERLRGRLSRRGIGAPAIAVCVSALSAKVSLSGVHKELADPLVRAAVRAGLSGSITVESISMAVLTLTEGVLKTMSMAHLKMAAIVVVAIGLTVGGAGVWASQKTASVRQPSPGAEVKAEFVEPAIPTVVARVNGVSITREQLAERCLTKYGSRELQTLIAMVVIDNACARRGITVSDAEIVAEALRIAQSVGVSASDFYNSLLKQRGISKEVYLRDIVTTNLKLKKLGVDPNSDGGKSFLEGIMKKFEGRADIEILWGEPSPLGEEPARKSPPRTEEDRLRDVERTLGQVLRTLEELKRPVGGSNR